MYPPSLFREDRVDVLHALIDTHPLGLLVTHGVGLRACHVPMLIDAAPAPFGTLFGHVARANPVLSDIGHERGGDDETDGNREATALAVFQGPQHYITPSWYPSKRDHGRVVPTWNYVGVHAEGRLRFHDDPAWVHAHLTALTDKQEQNRDEPWAVTDAPTEFVDSLLSGIVGFELTITHLVGTWKTSQNRPPVDQAGVVAGLRDVGSDAALAMADLVADRCATARSSDAAR